MRRLMNSMLPLPVQAAFYGFALTLPTAALKTFSLLSGIALPTAVYVIGAVFSLVIFWVFFTLIWSVLSWTGKQT
jgi:hypothetical protein